MTQEPSSGKKQPTETPNLRVFVRYLIMKVESCGKI
jgi:hypothetical protein